MKHDYSLSREVKTINYIMQLCKLDISHLCHTLIHGPFTFLWLNIAYNGRKQN